MYNARSLSVYVCVRDFRSECAGACIHRYICPLRMLAVAEWVAVGAVLIHDIQPDILKIDNVQHTSRAWIQNTKSIFISTNEKVNQ
jgi:hypothetical protein